MEGIGRLCPARRRQHLVQRHPAALEGLVARYPKDEYWQNLMRSMFRTGGSDAIMLNVFRLATEVNAMRRAEDYTEMAHHQVPPCPSWMPNSTGPIQNTTSDSVTAKSWIIVAISRAVASLTLAHPKNKPTTLSVPKVLPMSPV